jgi:hypothetical protein
MKYANKYFVSFGNTYEIEHGTFYIGIEDDGKKSGIPCFDTIPNMKKTITYYLYSNILNCITYQFGTKAFEYLQKIKKFVSIDIIQLSKNTILLDDNIDEITEKYQQELCEYKKKVYEYNLKRKAWSEKVCHEKRSIILTINDEKVRKGLVKYISEYSLENFNYFFNKIVIPKLFEMGEEKADSTMLNYLKARKTFEIVKVKMIAKLITAGKIIFDKAEIVANRYNPYHFSFWNGQYKDMVVDKLQLIKPPKKYFIPPNDPTFIVRNDFTLLSKRILQDDDFFYFYIKITLPSRKSLDFIPDNLYYISNGSIKCKSRKTCHDGSPCCI